MVDAVDITSHGHIHNIDQFGHIEAKDATAHNNQNPDFLVLKESLELPRVLISLALRDHHIHTMPKETGMNILCLPNVVRCDESFI